MLVSRRPACSASQILAALLVAAPLLGQGTPPRQRVQNRQVAPGVYLISQPAGNMLVMVGKDGPVVVGIQAPSLVAEARELLASLHAPRVKYVLAISGDSAVQLGDGGWGRDGATAIAHEGIRNKIRWTLKSDSTAWRRFPAVGFADVFQLSVNGDEIHAVHQPGGFSDADVIVHFEERHFIYLGNLFTSDGYPSIDLARGGSIAGLITASKKFVDMWSDNPEWVQPVVPGRGPPATLKDLKDYHDMLAAVRDRVEPLVRAGRTVQEVVASRPTAEFDARWGHGPVAPDRFVSLVYGSVEKELRSSKGTGG